jgi:hypothetical protein
MEKNQEKIKSTFNHKEKERDFAEGDLVMLWDKRRENPGMHKKLDGLWAGPYKIMSLAGSNSFNLGTLGGEDFKLPMNVVHIKHYQPPPA